MARRQHRKLAAATAGDSINNSDGVDFCSVLAAFNTSVLICSSKLVAWKVIQMAVADSAKAR